MEPKKGAVVAVTPSPPRGVEDGLRSSVFSMGSSPESPSSEKERQQERRVRFRGVVYFRNHLHLDDMLPEECFRTWFSKGEIADMQEATKQMVRKSLKQGNSCVSFQEGLASDEGTITTKTSYPLSLRRKEKSLDTDKSLASAFGDLVSLDLFGLERHTRIGRMSRHRNKTMAWDAVMQEQDRQWNEDVSPNAELIAKAYRAAVEDATKTAWASSSDDSRSDKRPSSPYSRRPGSSLSHGPSQTLEQTRCGTRRPGARCA